MLPVALHRPDEQPGVDQRRDLLIAPARPSASACQAGEQRGHPACLQEVDLAGQHRRDVRAVPMRNEVGDRVHDHHRGIELADELLHREQVRLEAEQARAEALELQQAGVDPLPQVDADGGHVADDLGLGLLEGEVHRPLAAAQAASQNCAASVDLPVPAVPLTRTCCRGRSRRRPASRRGGPRRWTPARRHAVPQPERGDRQHGYPGSPIRNGYSLVPCSEPRYLRTRRRRVEVCSVTRWSSTITQSDTYSSMP